MALSINNHTSTPATLVDLPLSVPLPPLESEQHTSDSQQSGDILTRLPEDLFTHVYSFLTKQEEGGIAAEQLLPGGKNCYRLQLTCKTLQRLICRLFFSRTDQFLMHVARGHLSEVTAFLQDGDINLKLLRVPHYIKNLQMLRVSHYIKQTVGCRRDLLGINATAAQDFLGTNATAAHLAACGKTAAMLKVLLDKEPSLTHITDSDGRTPLFCANAHTVSTLLDHGADRMHRARDISPLRTICRRRYDPATLKAFLEYRSPILIRGLSDNTPLPIDLVRIVAMYLPSEFLEDAPVDGDQYANPSERTALTDTVQQLARLYLGFGGGVSSARIVRMLLSANANPCISFVPDDGPDDVSTITLKAYVNNPARCLPSDIIDLVNSAIEDREKEEQ